MSDLVDRVIRNMKAQNLMLVTAESCTGGLLAASIIQKPGASDVFERGFITYSNEAKSESLGVPQELIQSYGAVSSEVAEAMAEGALVHSRADLAVSITGIAGPDGGSSEKPVGLVYMGYALKGGSAGSTKTLFTGNRNEIQSQCVQNALKNLLSILESEST